MAVPLYLSCKINVLQEKGGPDGPPLAVLSAVKRQILPTKSR
jgi:hypothetical protein